MDLTKRIEIQRVPQQVLALFFAELRIVFETHLVTTAGYLEAVQTF